MRRSIFSLSIVCAGLLAAGAAGAQSPPADASAASDVESLKSQMREMQAALKQIQAQHQREVEALQSQVGSLRKVLGELQKSVTAGGAAPSTATAGAAAARKPAEGPGGAFPTTDESIVAAPPPTTSAPGAAPSPTAFPTTDATVAASPVAALSGGLRGAPITVVGGGKTFLNISFNSMFSAAASTRSQLDHLEVGDHDPQQRGFNARNTELAFDGAVDPYFEGFANIVFKLDNNNDTSVEVEEAYMQTTTLPWSLQLKGGQFFAPLGRINPQHPHTWDFVDAPLVSGRLLGPDGLRGVGAQISWLVPLPWYSQLSLAVQNGNGGTGFSFRNRGEDGVFYDRATLDRSVNGVEDMVFVPRVENSIDLTSTQTLVLGASGAFGPNDTGHGARTEIYGADLFYKWKPANAGGGWPFVKWQSEALLRRLHAERGVDDTFPVSETFDDWGAYSQVVWGFFKGWTAGLRGDYLHMEDSAFTSDPERQSRWRISPDLTWYPTEFSKLRLQYNHDWLESNDFLGSGNADSVFLQFEFNLGAHGAHKF